MKFEKGNSYPVLKDMGIRENKHGQLQLSQRQQDDPEMNVSEGTRLTCVEREDNQWFFETPGGTRVIGHPSHFDPNHPYNTKKSGGGKGRSSSVEVLERQLADKERVRENHAARLAKTDETIAVLREQLAKAALAEQASEAEEQPETGGDEGDEDAPSVAEA